MNYEILVNGLSELAVYLYAKKDNDIDSGYKVNTQ